MSTLAPFWRAVIAAHRPAFPPPRTRTSQSPDSSLASLCFTESPSGVCFQVAWREEIRSRATNHQLSASRSPVTSSQGGSPSECHDGCPSVVAAAELFASAEDFEDSTLRQRDHEQVAVGSRLDIRRDSKALAEQQALALGEIPLVEVVRHPVLQPRIAEDQIHSALVEFQPEQVTIEQLRRGTAQNGISIELFSQRFAPDKAEARRGDFVFPSQQRIGVTRSR